METTAATTVNLVKGGNVNLSKVAAHLVVLSFGLSWDVKDGHTFDVDAFAICRNNKGVFMGADHLLFFNSTKDAEGLNILGGALRHSGDNLTGAGDGDDEIITIDQSKIPADVETIIIATNIYHNPSESPALHKDHVFGNVSNAKIRVFDPADAAKSIAQFDLAEDFSMNNCVIFGELYRKDGEWKFRALGEGMNGTVQDVCDKYKA